MSSSINTPIFELYGNKHAVSPIDGKTYCKSNGHFLRHLKSHQHDYESMIRTYHPELVTQCVVCGGDSKFFLAAYAFNKTCCNECMGKVISQHRADRTPEEWEEWANKYKETMSNKSADEISTMIQSRTKAGYASGAYKASVEARRQTCAELYDDPTYNNPTKISASKLNWTTERKQLFLSRLRDSLGGSWLNSFCTYDTWYKRTENLANQGRIKYRYEQPGFLIYRTEVDRITRNTYRSNKHIINPENLPRGMASVKGTYHLDHVIPVEYGFMNNIPPEQIAAVENLQMLPAKVNISKGGRYTPPTEVANDTKS